MLTFAEIATEMSRARDVRHSLDMNYDSAIMYFKMILGVNDAGALSPLKSCLYNPLIARKQ